MFKDMIFRYRSGNLSSLEAFANDKLFFSTPEYFNDPFDSAAYVDYDKLWRNISYDLNNYIEESLERRKKELFSFVSDNNQEYFLKSAKDVEIRNEFFGTVRNTVEYVCKKITENCKIICFSEEYLSNLMWSHYANYHKGFLLGYSKENLKKASIYDDKDNILNKKKRLRKVEYTNDMTDFGEFMYNLLPYGDERMLDYCHSMLIKMISTKMNEWSYEKEWRLCSIPDTLKLKDPSYYLKIIPDCIFVGAKMESGDRWKLYNIAKQKKIPVFEVWCNTDEPSYKLNFCALNGTELRHIVKQ